MNLKRDDAQSDDYLQGVADGIAARKKQEAGGREDAARAHHASIANLPFWLRPGYQGPASKTDVTARADDGDDKEDRAREKFAREANRPFWERTKGGAS